MKRTLLTHVSDVSSEPDTQLIMGVQFVECETTVSLWIPATRVAGSFRYRMPEAYVMAVGIRPERAFGQ